MEFVNPSFLYGLLAIAIPIIIHLFNFRKFKKVQFTNVQFLKEVKEETQSKSKLKHLLVLLARILGITFLVLAFAQPFIPSDNSAATNTKNAVSIFIDNSFSMEAEGEFGPLLSAAKKYALEIVDNHGSTDQFQITTNDFEGKHRHFFNKEEIIELIQDVKSTPQSKLLSEVIALQLSDLKELKNVNRSIYYVSDFQEKICDFKSVKNDTTTAINLIPVESKSNENLYVDSIWFESPVHQTNQTEHLHVVIRNTSDQEYFDIPITLSINGSQKAIGSFSIGENESIDSTLTFSNSTSGLMSGVVEIMDSPIQYDDHLHFSYTVADSIPVLYVFEQDTNPAIRSVLNNDPLFSPTYRSARNMDYSLLVSHKLVILESLEEFSTGLIGELEKFSRNGNSIFIIPNTTMNGASYDELAIALQTAKFNGLDTATYRVKSINLEDNFYQNVFEKIPKNIDLPISQSHFKLKKHKSHPSTDILTLNNGESFLSRHNNTNGDVYLLASPLHSDFTNFAKHAIFVPTIYRMTLLSNSTDQLYRTIGKDNSIQINKTIDDSKEGNFHLTMGSELDIIPEYRTQGFTSELFLHHQISKSGFYELEQDEKTIMGLGFNYNRTESNLSYLSAEELGKVINEFQLTTFKVFNSASTKLSTALRFLNEGTTYWRTCIWIALIFFGLEIVLIKFWK